VCDKAGGGLFAVYAGCQLCHCVALASFEDACIESGIC
jgi:hypothetical protein